MSVNFLHPSSTGRGTGRAEPSSSQEAPQSANSPSIDWNAARRAGRACCCTARPVIIAIMPPTPNRPHPTDLLLCGHHYRLSKEGLAAAGATVLDFNGAPVAAEAWPVVLANA